MVIFVHSLHTNRRREFVVRRPRDLEPLFDEFPLTRRIAESSTCLKEAADKIVRYLSGHNFNSWVENDTFEKSVRNALIGFGMLAASPLLLGASQPQAPTNTPQGVASNSFVKPFGVQKEDSFLHNISQLESSGGTNVAHDPVRHGPYRGQKAIGKWGLLPTTIQEIVNRQKRLGTLRPEVAPLGAMNPDQMSTFIKKNPHIELHLARHLARHVLYRQGGNLARSAFSWKNGHNLMPADISDDDVRGNQYVKDFLALHSGKSVRGLKPFVQVSGKTGKLAAKPVAKAEEVSFVERVKNWLAYRAEDNRKMPIDTTRNPDPGRRKVDDPFQEVKPSTQKQKIQHAIEDAKRARKS